MFRARCRFTFITHRPVNIGVISLNSVKYKSFSSRTDNMTSMSSHYNIVDTSSVMIIIILRIVKINSHRADGLSDRLLNRLYYCKHVEYCTHTSICVKMNGTQKLILTRFHRRCIVTIQLFITIIIKSNDFRRVIRLLSP